MCQEISNASGDSIQVVDIVLWRYLERSYQKSETDGFGVDAKVAKAHKHVVLSGPMPQLQRRFAAA